MFMQKFVIMVQKQYLKSTKFFIRRSIFTTNPKSCLKDCNFVPPKFGFGSSSNLNQDFVEATKEIASLYIRIVWENQTRGHPSITKSLENLINTNDMNKGYRFLLYIIDHNAVQCRNKYGVSLLFTNVRHFSY